MVYCKNNVLIILELVMKKQKVSMKEISKFISDNNKKKPSKEKIDELFDVLKKEGLTEAVKNKKDKTSEDQVAKPLDREPCL